jgi:carbonic anhydrase/acetyltransferase-like protein (isoleucine patch superfamily)
MTLKSFRNQMPTLGENVYIDDSAIVIGAVVLGDDVSIWPTAVVRGDVEKITIGNNTNVQDGAVIHGCTVGNYCLIGIGAIIMDDAILEDYVMLGAGALVPPNKRLESGYLYVGSPAKQSRPLSESEKEFLRYSASHYVSLKNVYLEEG